MDISMRIARILGPTLTALGVTEAVNIDVFAGHAAAVVYLNGALLFVAGVGILQAGSRWGLNVAGLVTLSGWMLLGGGFYRMMWPHAPQLAPGVGTYVLLASIGFVGVFLTCVAYRTPSSIRA